MFDNDYILSLLDKCNKNDKKIDYITRKIERHGTQYISFNEYNYLRQCNDLAILNIEKLKECLYENMISYSDLEKEIKISRPMICMILRGTRNSTLLQISKILTYLEKHNIKFTF